MILKWLSDPAVSHIIEEREAGMLSGESGTFTAKETDIQELADRGREVEVSTWLSDPVVSQKLGIRSRNALL